MRDGGETASRPAALDRATVSRVLPDRDQKSQLVCRYASIRVTLRLPSLAPRASGLTRRHGVPGRLVVARERLAGRGRTLGALGQPLAEGQPPDEGSTAR